MKDKTISTLKKTPKTIRTSLRIKIVLPLVAIILVAGSAAAINTFIQTRKAFVEKEKYLIGEMATNHSSIVSSFFDNKVNYVKAISKNDFLMRGIFEGTLSGEQATQVLEQYDVEDIYLSIYVMDATGNTLVSTDPNFVGKNYGFREYFTRALDGVSDIDFAIGVTSKELGYYFSAPIELDGKIVGVVVTKLEPEEITRVIETKLQNFYIEDSGLVQSKIARSITDENGLILHSTETETEFKFIGDPSQEFRTNMIERKLFEGLEIADLGYDDIQEHIENEVGYGYFETQCSKGDCPMVLALSKADDYPFYIVTGAATEEISVLANRSSIMLGISVLIAALVTLIVLIIVVDRILMPLKTLSDAITPIEGAEDEIDLQKLKINTGDEIEELANAISELTNNLLIQKRSVEAQIEKQTKQLKQQKIALINVLDDVQIEKDIANAAASELEKFKLATDNVSEHIVITDPDGVVIYANKAVEKITGFSNSEVLGKKAGGRDLWGGNMPRNFYVEMWYTIKEKKQPFSGEIKNRRKDGEEYIAFATISPVLDDNGEVLFFVGIERDITKEKEVDRMKTEFISLASHQLRTPLSAMKWFLEMLLNEEAGKLGKTQKEFLKNVDQSNERMIDLVNSLLNVSRIESGRIIVDPVPTKIDELLEQVIKDLGEKIKSKKMTLNLDVDKDLPTVNLDKKLIRHVYLNLLTNSIKYTPEKGEINLSVKIKDNELISEVSDNGYGITENDKDKVFNKFFRGENIVTKDTDGNGLGLYMVKAIVESSKGRIWFESEEDKGTTFWFALPLEGMEPKEGVVTLQD